MSSHNVLKYLLHVALPIPMKLFTCIFISALKSENNHVCVCMCMLVAQSCPTVYDPMDCSPPGSSVHGILQARILEWVAMPFSRGIFPAQGSNQVSHTTGRFFTVWATREAHKRSKNLTSNKLILQFETWIVGQYLLMPDCFSQEEWFFPRDCLLNNTK